MFATEAPEIPELETNLLSVCRPLLGLQISALARAPLFQTAHPRREHDSSTKKKAKHQ